MMAFSNYRSAIAAFLLLSPVLFVGCAELQDLRQIKAYQDRQITELERTLDRKTMEQAALEKQVREVSRQSQTTSDEVNRLNRQLEETKQALEAANAQLEAVGGQLQTKDQSLTQTAASLEEQARKAKLLAEQVTQNQTDLTKANDLLKQKDGEIAKIREELAAVAKRAETAEKSLKDMEAQLAKASSDSENAVASLKKENEDLAAKLKTAQASGGSTGAGAVNYEEALTLLEQSLKPVIDARMATVSRDSRGVAIRLSTDYLFRPDTMDLDSQVHPTLDQIAAILNRYPNAYVEVQGHTDSQAIKTLPFSDNWALAAARAQKVVRYLAESTPLKSSRMKSSSASEYRPIREGAVKMDRRVEIILTNQP